MAAIDSVEFLQNQPSPGYSARSVRRQIDYAIGEGVDDYASFRVTFSASLTVSISTGIAFLRGNSNADQGMYRCELLTAKTDTLAAADATNPRIDCVVLQVQDAAEDAGAGNQAVVTHLTGTPTAGATLDNRNGAPSLAVSSPTLIILADVLVNANNSPALSNSYIRDRRPFAVRGTVPAALSTVGKSIVLFDPPAGVNCSSTNLRGDYDASHSAAMAMYLPRRIAATHVRWRYRQDGTVVVGTGQNWNIAICDASGRLIGQTGNTAFAGAIYTFQNQLRPFNPALSAGYVFEAGWYYVWFGISAVTSTSIAWYMGYPMNNQDRSDGYVIPTPGLYYHTNAQGTTFDASNTINNMSDQFNDVSPSRPSGLAVPQIALSIG